MGKILTGAAAIAALAIGAGPAVAGEITLQNRDGVPFDDRLTVSKMGNPKGLPSHDVATVRIVNDGTTPLVVSGLALSGPFALDQPVALPASIPAGGGLDVAVRYTATTAGSPVAARHDGTLTITSDDADEGTLPVELAGLWQEQPEGAYERTLSEIVSVFGYRTEILKPGQKLANKSKVEAVGDEVLSPYWKRADSSRPVAVHQLAGFRNPGPTGFFWYPKGTSNTQVVFTSHDLDYQTILPRKQNALDQPAAGTFTPGANPVFGFRVSNTWSDPTKNPYPTNCLTTFPNAQCGHNIRFFPVKDRSGAVVPNTYLLAHDFISGTKGGNYDYQDHVYLISNIQPENAVVDTVAPAVSARVPGPGAAGVDDDASITVTFSEPIAPASVTATTARVVQGGTAVPAARTLSADGTTLTIDPDAPLADGATHVVELTAGITDVAGNPLAPVAWSFTTASGPGGPYQFADGRVVMEAENADEVVARGSRSWQPGAAPAGSAGGAMTVLADGGSVFEAATAATTAPELRFQVDFPAAGTYQVAARGNAPNTSGNSLHVGLNGVIPSTADALTLGTFANWLWFAGSAGGPNPATITVPSAGVHTVSVWAREDGMSLDRLIIAPTVTPLPTGEGPAESPRPAAPPPPQPTTHVAINGAVTMEAENAAEVVDRSGTGWDAGLAPAGAVGGALTVPNAGVTWGNLTTVPTVSPEIRFQVNFDQPGTYRVWVRSNPLDTGGDSLHVGLNGAVTATSDAVNSTSYGNWVWAASSAGGPNPATVTVPSAGVHTVSIYGREDGMSVDRVHMSITGAAPTGSGPEESPRI